MTRYYLDNIEQLKENQCFVFGSNLVGRHGEGAAWQARNSFRAIYGRGIGFTGDCYAIPTKDHNIETIPLDVVKYFVGLFLEDATLSPDLEFLVTKIGCGLAGYTDAQIAPMFKGAPVNCVFHEDWKPYLE